MIDLITLIEILAGVFFIGGGIVGFFVMQKGQNMKIAQLEKDMKQMKKDHEKELLEVKRKQSLSTGNQIRTEKDLVAINIKLDHIIEAIDEIKNERSNHNTRAGD